MNVNEFNPMFFINYGETNCIERRYTQKQIDKDLLVDWINTTG